MGYRLDPKNFTAALKAELRVHYVPPGQNDLKGKTSAEIYYTPYGQSKVQWPVDPDSEWTYVPSPENPTLIKIPLMPTAGDSGSLERSDSPGGEQDPFAGTGVLQRAICKGRVWMRGPCRMGSSSYPPLK